MGKDMATATLTSKGQLTIPLAVRQRLGLKTGDRIDFVFAADGSITLLPVRIPFENLRGILRSPAGRAPLTLDDMDRAIARQVRLRWRRAAGRRRR